MVLFGGILSKSATTACFEFSMPFTTVALCGRFWSFMVTILNMVQFSCLFFVLLSIAGCDSINRIMVDIKLVVVFKMNRRQKATEIETCLSSWQWRL